MLSLINHDPCEVAVRSWLNLPRCMYSVLLYRTHRDCFRNDALIGTSSHDMRINQQWHFHRSQDDTPKPEVHPKIHQLACEPLTVGWRHCAHWRMLVIYVYHYMKLYNALVILLVTRGQLKDPSFASAIQSLLHMRIVSREVSHLARRRNHQRRHQRRHQRETTNHKKSQ